MQEECAWYANCRCDSPKLTTCRGEKKNYSRDLFRATCAMSFLLLFTEEVEHRLEVVQQAVSRQTMNTDAWSR